MLNLNSLKEEKTGLVSGVGDFIKANAPGAVNMPTAAYEHYFIDHWAKDTEYEAKHRELTKSIGESIRGKPGRKRELVLIC